MSVLIIAITQNNCNNADLSGTGSKLDDVCKYLIFWRLILCHILNLYYVRMKLVRRVSELFILQLRSPLYILYCIMHSIARFLMIIMTNIYFTVREIVPENRCSLNRSKEQFNGSDYQTCTYICSVIYFSFVSSLIV